MNSTNPVGRRRFQVDYDRPKDEYPNNNPRRDEDDVFGYRHLKPIGSKAYEPNCKQECDHAATEFSDSPQSILSPQMNGLPPH